MVPATLHDFLVLGILGPLRHGLTPDEVRSVCGEPQDTSVSTKPRIWKYESLQVAFCRKGHTAPESLDFIGLYYRDEPFQLPTTIPLAGWWPSVGATLATFKKYLDDFKIPFCIDPQLTWDTQTSLIVGVGVGVCFTIDEGEMILDSMQYSVRKQAANKALNPTGNKPAS
jgi:hypothetical protein